MFTHILSYPPYSVLLSCTLIRHSYHISICHIIYHPVLYSPILSHPDMQSSSLILCRNRSSSVVSSHILPYPFTICPVYSHFVPEIFRPQHYYCTRSQNEFHHIKTNFIICFIYQNEFRHICFIYQNEFHYVLVIYQTRSLRRIIARRTE